MRKPSFWRRIEVLGLALALLGLALAPPHGQASAAGRAVDLQGFRPLAADEGWILASGRLYWTRTGGRSWDDLTPPDLEARAIAAASFVDAQHGWLALVEAGEAGAVAYALARTADGGRTWSIAPLALFAPGDPAALAGAVSLYFLDRHTGWLAVRRATSSNFRLGSLFQTSDGGDTWTRLPLPGGGPVYFATAKTGWTAGGAAGDELYRTVDGGRTWQRQTVGSLPAEAGQERLYQLPAFDNPRQGVLPVLVATDEQSRVEFYATADGGQTWQPTPTAGPDRLPAGVGELAMATSQVGWARLMSGQCTPPGPARRCDVEIELLQTSDGGQSWQRLSLPPGVGSRPRPAPVPGGRGEEGSSEQNLGGRLVTFVGQGFDKCEVAPLDRLQTWFAASPYSAVNLYIGGACRGCANSALSASYVAQMSQQGWKFIPTWVGPQSACWNHSDRCSSSRISNDPAEAYNQGVAEADAAIAAATNLGLAWPDGSGTIVYYDLEAYTFTDATCRAAAQAFVSGWTARLWERGNQAGVYGAGCGSAISELATIDHVPNQMWAAHWIFSSYNASASVWDVACLANHLWANHQRLRQYAGGHNETWDSVTLNIDCNVLDGVVADTSGLCCGCSSTVSSPTTSQAARTAMPQPWIMSTSAPEADGLSSPFPPVARPAPDLRSPSSAGYQLARHVAAMGGGVQSSAGYRVQASSGQATGVGWLHGLNYQVYSGFWGPVHGAAPLRFVYLPLILR